MICENRNEDAVGELSRIAATTASWRELTIALISVIGQLEIYIIHVNIIVVYRKRRKVKRP